MARGQRNQAIPNLPNDINAPTQRLQYYRILLEFMRYSYPNQQFADDIVFTNDQLSVIRPIQIYRWLCFKVYGNENPEQTDKPTKRSMTIEYWKKGISHFMNTTSKWNEAAQTSNPTQLKMVNNLIQVVQKVETRGNGAESHADWPFTKSEFRQILKLMPMKF